MKRFGPVMVLLILFALLTASNARADQGIDGLTNQHRAAHGLATLTTSPQLTSFAAQRAVEAAGNFAHSYWWWGPSGCNSIGENLVMRLPAPEDGASYAVNAWIDSPAHNANLLGDWDITGSAVYQASDGWWYAAQLFGKDCAGVPLPTPAPAPRPQSPTPPQPPAATPAPPAEQARPSITSLPDTAMRSPCQTSRTLRPSLNRMTRTSSPF